MNISVIIPAYNSEKWITRAIESVLNQTVPVMEIFVIDDGSTDNTAEAVKRYKEPVRYIRQKNAGAGVARNKGIETARGEWIAFLDADDEWLPFKIESQISFLMKNPTLKWCNCARVSSRNVSTSLAYVNAKKEKFEHKSELDFFSASVKNISFTTSGFVIHKTVFEELGSFDPEMPAGQDMDLWCRIAMKYPLIGYCFKPCWIYHKDNPESITVRARKCRTRQLMSLCTNMNHAIELGPDIAKNFYPYGKKKVMDNLLRLAARDCIIESDVTEEAKQLFPLTLNEKTILWTLKLLPKPIAHKLSEKLRDWIGL